LKALVMALWLTVSLTQANCETQLIIQVPPEMRAFTTIDGAPALYFHEDDWIAFSQWMYEGEMAYGEAVAAETARPLLVEIAGLKAERDEAKKRAARITAWKWAAVILGGIVVGEGAALLLK
jgi:hypothetical protein